MGILRDQFIILNDNGILDNIYFCGNSSIELLQRSKFYKFNQIHPCFQGMFRFDPSFY